MDARKRVMLITGAAGGIGRATVHVFSGHGWAIIGVDRNTFGDEFPKNGKFIHADISDPKHLEMIYGQAREFSQTLDAIVNNAGIQVSKPILDTSMEEWDAVMASNLRSVFISSKLAYPLLKNAGGGAIVNVSSVHAVATSVNIAAYAASKGGLLALTRAMAIEFAPDNIRVNAILPGGSRHPHASCRDAAWSPGWWKRGRSARKPGEENGNWKGREARRNRTFNLLSCR